MKTEDRTAAYILARHHLRRARAIERQWSALHAEITGSGIIDAACSGKRITSGIGACDEYTPASLKDALRALDREHAAALDMSAALWVQSGRRMITWRRARECAA